MIPAPRDLPVISVVYEDLLHRWIVRLPGGVQMPANDTADAEEIVRKYAPGSSVRFYRATEGENRELWGR
jgi:hypothetical protein